MVPASQTENPLYFRTVLDDGGDTFPRPDSDVHVIRGALTSYLVDPQMLAASSFIRCGAADDPRRPVSPLES